MLQDPLGIVAFIASVVFWAIAIFKPSKPQTEEQNTTSAPPAGNLFATRIAQLGFLIALTLATSFGLYAILQNFENSPLGSSLLLAGLAFLAWLLLTRPERFAMLLIGGIVVFGSIGLISQCSSTGSDSLEFRPPRSL